MNKQLRKSRLNSYENRLDMVYAYEFDKENFKEDMKGLRDNLSDGTLDVTATFEKSRLTVGIPIPLPIFKKKPSSHDYGDSIRVVFTPLNIEYVSAPPDTTRMPFTHSYPDNMPFGAPYQTYQK